MPRLAALHVYPVKSVHRTSPAAAEVQPWGLAGDRRWMLADRGGRPVTQREQPCLARVRAEVRPDGGLLLTAPGAAPLVVRAPAVDRGDPPAQVDVWGTVFQAAEAAGAAHAWFAALLDPEGSTGGLRLVHLDDPRRRPVDPDYAPGETVSMADGYPVLLTTTASLARLNGLIAADHSADPVAGAALPMERFRPNLVVDGTEPWAEDSWHRIRVGEVVFRVVKPCSRCVVTTTDQESGERRGPEPLRALGRHRRFGRRLVFGQNLVPERPAGLRGDLLGTVRTGDEVVVLDQA